MGGASETLKAARASHRLSLLASFTALAVLFTPPKVDYGDALVEAHTIRGLATADYEAFLRGRLPETEFRPTPTAFESLTDFLRQKAQHRNETPSWTIGDVDKVEYNSSPIVSYETVPDGASLEPWMKWLQSTKEPTYFSPDWRAAAFSMSRAPPSSAVLVRAFSVRQSVYRRTPGEYSFRVYLELPTPSEEVSLWPNWWRAADALNTREFFTSKDFRLRLGESRIVLEGDCNSKEKAVQGGSVRAWLETRGLWSRLTRNDSLGEVLLPAITSHWPRLQRKSLDDAIRFMDEEMARIDTIELFGIHVPGQMFVVAAPLAFLLLSLHILVHARFIRGLSEATMHDDILEAPWVCLYGDRVSILLTRLSILILPVALSAAILLKHAGRVGVDAIIFSALMILCLLFVAFATSRSIDDLRARRESGARRPEQTEP
ncbi:MAG: hypothetical protein AAGD10_10430 [Myxococcota bacterium]